MRKHKLLFAGVTAVTLFGSAGIAYGATSAVSSNTPLPPPVRIGCDTGVNRAITWSFENASSFYASAPKATTANQVCAAHGGGFAVSLSNTGTAVTTGATGPAGPAGPTGKTGLTGAAGPAGPSGVTSAVSTVLAESMSIPTGGSFLNNATEVGLVTLKAGTYLLNLSAKATPNDATATAQIFPQFFVYNGHANATFIGDLMNVGAAALEPYSTNHDSYYSGTTLITLASDTTLVVYAFGYDSDSGAGSYTLDDVTVTSVGLSV